MAASSKEEMLVFGAVCDILIGSGKLPGIAKYGVVGLVRAAFITASGYEPSWVEMDERTWDMYLQRMSCGTVAPTFASLDVPSLHAAVQMVSALRATFAKHHGYRLSVHTNRGALMYLPCIVCEYAQVLDAVIAANVGIHDRGGAVVWLLAHLPDTEQGVRSLAKTMRIRTQLSPQRGDGQDLQCGGCVAANWIRNFVKVDPKVMALSSTRLKQRAASVEAEMARLSGEAPERRCSLCDGNTMGDNTHRLRESDGAAVCRECYQKRRRAADAERKRRMRRRLA